MSEIFFCSDTHFCHNQQFLYEPRGFSSVEEMDEKIIENWNKIVPKDGITYLLGDVMLSDTEKGLEYFKRLNGEICLIFGNHDTPRRQEELAKLPNVIILGYAHMFKYKKLNFYVSHYPTLTANFDADKHFSTNIIACAGHTHSKSKFLDENNPFLYNVCMDAHNCYPVHIDEVISDCRNKFLSLRGE